MGGYYWVVAWGRTGTRLEGKRSLFGPFATSVRAQEFSDGLLGETDVHEFPTRNQARATQLLKAKGVEVEIGKEGNWEEQSAFVRHPKKEVV